MMIFHGYDPVLAELLAGKHELDDSLIPRSGRGDASPHGFVLRLWHALTGEPAGDRDQREAAEGAGQAG